MRYVLTNAIVAREETEVEIWERVLVDGEVLLLCSDGLHGGLNDETLDRGGNDNITALLLRQTA